MASGTLYTYPENFRSYRSQIAARYSGANLAVKSSKPEFVYGETNKSDAFLKKFPTGKVPAFESNNGVRLFEPSAIAFYVSNQALKGTSPEDQAHVMNWVEFADNEILPASCTWVFPCLGIMQYNKQQTEKAKEEVTKCLKLLNEHLQDKTYLVGERITLADITVCCNLLQLYQHVLDPEFRKSFIHTNRWFTTMVNQPNVKAIISQFSLCTKMAQFDAKKFAATQSEGSGKKEGGKKEKAPKQEQPKKEPAPKKEEPKEQAEDEDDGMPKEKPSKDPFGHLPKGTMNLDEWKRTYSNNPPDVYLDWFFNNFDKETYSVWTCEYLFPEELKLTFMTANLVGGMFQRIERMRKHAFGSMIVFGENYKNTICGLWFWRGQDLAFTLSEDLQVDYESYKWEKQDYDKPETKAMIKEYFMTEGEFGGKQVSQSKIFK